MKITPAIIVNTVLTAVLLSSLFFIAVTAQTSPYDPWRDFDDDGDIDIFDIVDIADRYGTIGTPMNKTQLLLDLESRVTSIEETLTRTRWIRFHEQNETLNSQSTYKDAAIFTWTPNSSSDNAILSVRCYFEYRCLGQGMQFKISINGESISSGIGWLTKLNYTQSPVYDDYDFGDMRILPNQSAYTIKVLFAPQSSSDTAHMKNVNVLIEVSDALPQD